MKKMVSKFFVIIFQYTVVVSKGATELFILDRFDFGVETHYSYPTGEIYLLRKRTDEVSKWNVLTYRDIRKYKHWRLSLCLFNVTV